MQVKKHVVAMLSLKGPDMTIGISDTGQELLQHTPGSAND